MVLYSRDGFEHSNLGVYSLTSGTPTFVSSPVRTDLVALEISTAAAAEQVRYNVPSGNRRVTQSFYIRFASLPGANVQIAHITQTTPGRIYYNSSTTKFAMAFGGGSFTDFGPVLTTDTWYLVDMEYNTTADPWRLNAQVDLGGTTEATNAGAPVDLGAVGLGTSEGHTFTAYYDDWGSSITAGDYPIGTHAYFDPTLTLRIGGGHPAAGN